MRPNNNDNNVLPVSCRDNNVPLHFVCRACLNIEATAKEDITFWAQTSREMLGWWLSHGQILFIEHCSRGNSWQCHGKNWDMFHGNFYDDVTLIDFKSICTKSCREKVYLNNDSTHCWSLILWCQVFQDKKSARPHNLCSLRVSYLGEHRWPDTNSNMVIFCVIFLTLHLYVHCNSEQYCENAEIMVWMTSCGNRQIQSF